MRLFRASIAFTAFAIVALGADVGLIRVSDRQQKFSSQLAAEFQALKKANSEVLIRPDGWLFFGPELRLLSVGKFWGPEARQISAARNPDEADPMTAIVDFANQLKQHGIRLLLVPVPPKAAVYPDKALPGFDLHGENAAPYLTRFYDELRGNGVEVLDLAPLFWQQRDSDHGHVFCKTDTHWSGYGCVLAAHAMAEKVKLSAPSRHDYATNWKQIEMTGDLVNLLPPGVQKPQPEKIFVREVGERANGRPVQPDVDSPILLMGDSHTLVYHDFVAQAAGLLDQLADELGFPPDLIGTRGSGATAVRVDLYRRSRKNPGYLAKKKMIIWCFSAPRIYRSRRMGPDSRFQVTRSPVAKSACWMATLALQLAAVASFASSPTVAPQPSSTPTAQPTPSAKNDNGITVLFLGDSLSLCGFGKRLDERFRQMPGVKSVYSYMCCATHPLSWLKAPPYSNVKTRCGYWSIESVPGSAQPKEIEDVYGMRRGSVPKVYPVPKLDDLLTRIHPDVLIMQTGGNLFDLFPDHKTVRSGNTAELRKFVFPFISKAISRESPLKKIYWVASPISGRVSQQVQDFVVEQVRGYFGPAATVIDSRPLVAYPYHHMERDREHFIGEDMDDWADKVFGIVSQDLSKQSVASLKPLAELFPQIAAASPTPTPAAVAVEGQLTVTARLVFKSKPMRTEEFLPYQESMVGFVYDVRNVAAGEYDDPQILVMHPAYIGLKKQSLHKYRIGKTYKLRLRELAGTPWSTVKRRDDSGRIDLQPYIRIEDEAKYPGTTSAQ